MALSRTSTGPQSESRPRRTRTLPPDLGPDPAGALRDATPNARGSCPRGYGGKGVLRVAMREAGQVGSATLALQHSIRAGTTRLVRTHQHAYLVQLKQCPL